jgi:nitrite reductase (NADH) small subunit
VTAPDAETLVDVASTSELAAAGKRVVAGPHGEILVLWNDGEPTALVNTCIHKERRLSDGFLLKGRVVCPGHQWSFDVRTGFCKERDKWQPTYQVRVEGDRVSVATATLAAPSGMGPFGVVDGAARERPSRLRQVGEGGSGTG